MGFTLTELLIVLTCLAILSCLVEPDLKKWHETNKHKVIVESLVNELLLARSLAISTRDNISYCAAINQHWREKRLIINAKQEVKTTFPPLPANYQLSLRNSLSQNTCLTFTPLGFTNAQLASFYLISPVAKTRIIITLSGTTRFETDMF